MRDLMGKTFVLTGHFEHMSRDQLRGRIYKAGGTCQRLTASIDYLVVGRSPGAKYVTAQNLGVPILTEQEFLLYLDGQEIVREQAEARSVDDLLGEVRSVMQGPPDSEMWHALIELVDVCVSEDVEVLTRYIDDYIARWSASQMQGKKGTAGHQDAEGIYSSQVFGGERGGIAGELRVAPDHWVGQLQQGLDSPKFALVRALDLRLSKLTATQVNAILTHPHLTQLEHLELPEFTKSSKTLIKTLCTHPNTEKLAWLKLGKIDAKTLEALHAHGQQPRALRVLDLSCLTGPWELERDETFASFLPLPWCKDIEQLIISQHLGIKSLNYCDKITMTGLHHIHLVGRSTHTPPFLREVLAHPIMGRAHVRIVSVERLDLNHKALQIALRDALAVTQESSLARLDLGQIDLPEDESVWEQWWEECVGDCAVLSRVDTFVLGAASTPHIVELLAAHYPDLEVL